MSAVGAIPSHVFRLVRENRAVDVRSLAYMIRRPGGSGVNEGFCVAQWSTFAVIAGGAAAGLTGLLFVAVSIRIDVIARSP
jgi:hypothetical protein